jgi:hypothetical protein
MGTLTKQASQREVPANQFRKSMPSRQRAVAVLEPSAAAAGAGLVAASPRRIKSGVRHPRPQRGEVTIRQAR